MDNLKVDLDSGEGHTLTFTNWHLNRELNPQFADLPDDKLVNPGSRRNTIHKTKKAGIERPFSRGRMTGNNGVLYPKEDDSPFLCRVVMGRLNYSLLEFCR
jgi:hypothetical protein